MKRVFVLSAIAVLGCGLMGAAIVLALALANPQSRSGVPGISDKTARLAITCPDGYHTAVYAAGLSAPDGLGFGPGGVLYVAEEKGDRVSRIEAYGAVRPVLQGLTEPEGIAFDDVGDLYVVEDRAGGRLIKLTAGGVTTTLATDRDAPEGVVWTADGTIALTESNFQFASPLDFRTHVTTVAPDGSVTRIRRDTLFWSYAGIVEGPAGLLYVTNEASGQITTDSIFRIDPSSGARTLFVAGLLAPEGLRFSPNNDFPLYVVEEGLGGQSGRLTRVETDGSHTPVCDGFQIVEDVAVDDRGRLYVSEDGSGSVIRIEAGSPNRRPPQGIILFIGDGMGEAQRLAGRWKGLGQMGALAMDRMPYGGMSRTAAADGAVTDSAAAATALATGHKTLNGVIGQDPGGNALVTILERAKARGWSVGLVTNVQIAHATPAAFAAHVPNRTMMTEIASQMLAAKVDVLLGGGEDEFLPSTVSGRYPEPGERTDGRNLIDEALADGYTYVSDAAGLAAVDPSATTRLLGLFADEGMARPFAPSLAEMTQVAIELLSQNADGFFLMVEGGQIDWAAHANDADNVMGDTIDFDQAVGVAQAFPATAGELLVVVTADHETGGMDVSLASSGAADEDGPYFMPGGTPFYVNWSTLGHTGLDVPTTAQGPWSDLVFGTFENTTIHDVMRLALESSPALTLTQVAVPLPGTPVRPGDHITYSLALTNDGSGDAASLVLTDTLSAGVTYVPGSLRATAGLSLAAGLPPTFVLTGTLSAGRTVTATFGVVVAAVPSGTLLVNRIAARAWRSGLITDTIAHPVLVRPDLGIVEVAEPPSGAFVGPGDPITYTVVASNDGDLARDVVLSNTLDLTNLTLVYSKTTKGLLGGRDPVRVTDFDLGRGQAVTLTLQVTVVGQVSGTIITNRTRIDSVDIPSSRSGEEVMHVIGPKGGLPPDFLLLKRAEPPDGAVVTWGDLITYTVAVHNRGGPATGVVLSDPIPAATGYVSGSLQISAGDGADFLSAEDGRVIIRVPSFWSATALTGSFRVRVVSTLTQSITNTATLASNQSAARMSNPISHHVKGWRPVYLPLLLKSVTLSKPALDPP